MARLVSASAASRSPILPPVNYKKVHHQSILNKVTNKYKHVITFYAKARKYCFNSKITKGMMEEELLHVIPS